MGSVNERKAARELTRFNHRQRLAFHPRGFSRRNRPSDFAMAERLNSLMMIGMGLGKKIWSSVFNQFNHIAIEIADKK